MGNWSDGERQREHDREIAFNLGAQSRDAEIVRLKAEVERLRAPLYCLACANHGADLAAHKRALAAGPAALRAHVNPHTNSRRANERYAALVEAAQEAVLKEGK